MTRAQALRKAIKLWGRTAAVRDDGPDLASTPERRAAAAQKLRELRNTLPTGPWAGMTTEDRRARRKLSDDQFSESVRYRYTVGRIELGLFFAVRGQGDTWELAFAAAEKHDQMAA